LGNPTRQTTDGKHDRKHVGGNTHGS
jgi:hypothetical protein